MTENFAPILSRLIPDILTHMGQTVRMRSFLTRKKKPAKPVLQSAWEETYPEGGKIQRKFCWGCAAETLRF